MVKNKTHLLKVKAGAYNIGHLQIQFDVPLQLAPHFVDFVGMEFPGITLSICQLTSLVGTLPFYTQSSPVLGRLLEPDIILSSEDLKTQRHKQRC